MYSKKSSLDQNKISIFTVNWNGLQWLNKYLECVTSQTYKNLEILVVDNASTDNSLNFIRQNFPQVRIIKNKKNVGLATATNIGVKESRGKYILFMNNDTWVEKDFVEKLFKFYSENDFMAVSAEEKRYKGNKSFICNTTIDPTGSPAFYVPTYSRKDKIFYLTVCFLCAREDFIKSGGMDKDFFMYYEDVDWFWKLTLMGKKFTVTNKCKIFHAGAGSSGSGVKYNTFLWRNQNTLQTLIKNYQTITLCAILPIYLFQNIVEAIFFLMLRRPDISMSYLEGWSFNIRKLKKTLKKRGIVQRSRVISDIDVLRMMFPGLSKLQLLKVYLFQKNAI